MLQTIYPLGCWVSRHRFPIILLLGVPLLLWSGKLPEPEVFGDRLCPLVIFTSCTGCVALRKRVLRPLSLLGFWIVTRSSFSGILILLGTLVPLSRTNLFALPSIAAIEVLLLAGYIAGEQRFRLPVSQLPFIEILAWVTLSNLLANLACARLPIDTFLSSAYHTISGNSLLLGKPGDTRQVFLPSWKPVVCPRCSPMFRCSPS